MTTMQWHELRECFDRPLLTPRAISLRGGNSDLRLLTLCGQHRHGYALQGDCRRLGFAHDPDLRLRISPLFFGGCSGFNERRPAPHEPVFLANQFGPDIIERKAEYPSLGLRMSESVIRTLDADYLWQSAWSRTAYRATPGTGDLTRSIPCRVPLVIEGKQPFTVSRQDDSECLVLAIRHVGDEAAWYLAVAGGDEPSAVLLAAESELGRAECQWEAAEPGIVFQAEPPLRVLAPGTSIQTVSCIVSLKLVLGLVESKSLVIAASRRSVAEAAALCEAPRAACERQRLAADWDQYLAHFPSPAVRLDGARTLSEQLAGAASKTQRDWYLDHAGQRQPQAAMPSVDDCPSLTDDDLSFTFAKAQWHTRVCERRDPTWGPTVQESFTCYYNGTFAWSLPLIGWYARRHFDPEYRHMMRSLMDCFRVTQADDGLLRCYVGWNSRPEPGPFSTQIPQYAWTVWQEYLDNHDRAWLAEWYEPLQRYTRVMDRRDAECRKLGLWCQRHFYDGLDMFPTVDGLLLRNEPCLYSAVYAAEQVRYLDVLARIAGIVEPEKAGRWRDVACGAQQRMEEHLWDEQKQWYGDILADGRRETVVGMSGLFAVAYGLLPEKHDRARVRQNLESLIAPYGVTTVAPCEPRYSERFFWRGPTWPACFLYAAGAARRYAPDLLPRIAAAAIRFAKAQPGVHECLEPHSGQVARYDEGATVMPGIAMVAGAYALAAALRIAAGEDLFALE